MRPEDLAELAAAMAAAGVARLELAGPEVRLTLERGAAPAAEDVAAADASGAVVAVTAPGVGTFLRVHPLHDAPLAGSGETVAAGQAIALLQVGALLVPVVAPVGGLIVDAAVEDGTLVGYGDRLFDLMPQD
jgi:acetyl-CoA carboxylase biotin carboxyl carrier protein